MRRSGVEWSEAEQRRECDAYYTRTYIYTACSIALCRPHITASLFPTSSRSITSSSTSISAWPFTLLFPFFAPVLLLMLPRLPRLPLFSWTGSSASSSSPKRKPLPLSLRFSSEANAECAALDANVDDADVESWPSIHEKLEDARVGRVSGGWGESLDDADDLCGEVWVGGEVCCMVEAGEVGCAVEADEAGRNALGIGGALAVRSGSAAGEVGSGDRRVAAALAVAWRISNDFLRREGRQ